MILRLIESRLRNRDGGVLLLGFIVIAIVMITLLPGIVAIGKVVDSNVDVLSIAQSASYAATDAICEGDACPTDRLIIDPDEAERVALSVITENIGHNIEGSNEYTAEVYVHNPYTRTVAESMLADPNCNQPPPSANTHVEDAPCWRDHVVGSYHRVPGVTVVLYRNVEVCVTWSIFLLDGNDDGCSTREVVGYGYAEFTTPIIEHENDIEFLLGGPPPQTDATDATLTWSITGDFDHTTIRCIINGSEPFACGNPGDTSGHGEIYRTGFAPGRHTFQMEVRGEYGISRSDIFSWIVNTPDRGFWIDGWIQFNHETNIVRVEWQPGGHGNTEVDMDASGCILRRLDLETGALQSEQSINCHSGTPSPGPWTYEMGPDDMQPNSRYELIVELVNTDGITAEETYIWEFEEARAWLVNGWQRTDMSIVNENPMRYRQSIFFFIYDSMELYDIDMTQSSCEIQHLDPSGNEISSQGVAASTCFGVPAEDRGDGWYRLVLDNIPVNERVVLSVTAVSEGSGLNHTREVPGNPEEPAHPTPRPPQWAYAMRYVTGFTGFDWIRKYYHCEVNQNGTCDFVARTRVSPFGTYRGPENQVIPGVRPYANPNNVNCTLEYTTNADPGTWITVTGYNNCTGSWDGTSHYRPNNNTGGGIIITRPPEQIRDIRFSTSMGMNGGTNRWSSATVSDQSCARIQTVPPGSGNIDYDSCPSIESPGTDGSP